MPKVLKRLLIFLIVLLIALPFNTAAVFAEDDLSSEDYNVTAALKSESNFSEYREYLSKYNDFEYAKNDILVLGSELFDENGVFIKSQNAFCGKDNVGLWENGTGAYSCKFNVTTVGLYNFSIEFLPLATGREIKLGFQIDGAAPFSESETLIFTRDFVDATEKPRKDAQNNEIAPEQVQSENFVLRTATDDTGAVLEPYCFALSAGEHTLTLKGNGYKVAISQIKFIAPEKTVSYKELSKSYKVTKMSSVKPIIIEAEKATLKSDNTLIPKAANGSIDVSPNSSELSLINVIGGGNWNTAGQKISWDFNVEKTGYYSFGAKYKQNELVGAESWRMLKIDGKIPFNEASGLRFSYGTGWQNFEFSDGKTPYYIYLEKGKHTLSLEVTLGELSEYYARLGNIVNTLGDMYLKIVMITGEVPDVNRDYELFSQIPDFNDTLKKASNDLKSLAKDMKTLSGSNGNQYTAAMENMKRVIDKMVTAKYIAHLYVKDYYTNYTTLSSWLGEMRKMPLTLDKMQFAFAGNDITWNTPSALSKIAFSLKRLVYSYASDYKELENDSDTPVLKMWVNWGRDQTMALDSLIRDSFTAKTGIKVDLQIVSNSLINGLLANNFPDIQLHLARTSPVNYGMRGALLDLSQFDDYKDVLKRFHKDADIPYWYNGALYALPDTQSFYTMFYRTDIFEQLGLKVPKTWDEFLFCATIIQRYNMNVYVPYTQITTTTTVNSGIGSLHVYPTLMLQNGLNLYNKKHNATNIITPEGIEVFEKWTKMYTDYGYLKEADFYNRFRNGSMPLGIAPYSTYFTIYSAAPEIEGRWTVANVPGVDSENRQVAGGGTGCAIVKRTKYPNEAWEFLKWWTSAEIQTRYSNNVESIIGMLGRVTTANMEAFRNLAWDPDDLNKLLNQFENVTELPEVPGSYYLTRAVDQAFWAVINSGNNPKDAVTEWSLVADAEIARKIKEYS